MMISSFLSWHFAIDPKGEGGKLYSIVTTAALRGMDAVLVQVEADVSPGLPAFEMVGFLASEVKEAKERVRTALKNCGYPIPPKRITISFSPAGIRKSGTGFDLAVAAAILTAMGVIPQQSVEQTIFLGELNLSGKVLPIHGVLPMLAEAVEAGYVKGAVSVQNEREASLVPGMRVEGVRSLEQVVASLNGKPAADKADVALAPEMDPEEEKQPDFARMKGQRLLKRVCEIAAAGRHNLLMIGPPGTGKTMAARMIPSILPPMNEAEQIEVSKIYSICGMLDERQGLVRKRPFRNPHHTISPQGLCGGGGYPKPGEISLSHGGVLFLDELTEFKPGTLEILRQPMEEKKVRLVRANGKYEFPADFMLVAAMNPCACGHYPDMQNCRCSESEIRRYKNRISQPLLDRIDLCIRVDKIPYGELYGKDGEESSAQIRERVIEACERQRERYRGREFFYNSQIPAEQIAEFCRMNRKQKKEMEEIYDCFQLSARSYHKILKTARTIADLDGCPDLKTEHLHEALCYRSIDQSFWERRL